MTLSTAPYALVVDDDPLILLATCDILEDAGFRSYEAGSGDEALALLEEFADNVTLLFSDVEMPGMNGFALANHTAERWPWIEIVIVSGRVAPREGDLPTHASFIGKPFSANTVWTHLREKLPDGKKPEQLKRAV